MTIKNVPKKYVSFFNLTTCSFFSRNRTMMTQLEVRIKGIFEKNRLPEQMRHIIVFDDDGEGVLIKKDGRISPVTRREKSCRDHG